jgi:ATP-binding cassette subfamily B protein
MSDLEIEEDLAKRRLDRRALGRVLALARPEWRPLLVLAAIQVVLVASIFIRPWFVGQVIDHGFAAGVVAWGFVALMCLGLTVAWLGRFGLAGVAQAVGGRIAARVLNDLRRQVFDHVQRLPVAYFDRTRAGRIISRADRDVDALEPVIVHGPPELLSMLLRMVGAAVLLWWIDPRFVLAMLPPVLLLAVGMRLFQKAGVRLWGRTAECKSRMTAHLVESVSGVAVIQGATAEAANERRYRALLTDLDRSAVAGAWGWGWFAPFASVLWAAGIGVLLWIGAEDLGAGRITPGVLAQCLFYVILFLGPIQELGDLFEKAATGIASAQRIFLLLDTEPARDPADPVDPGPVHGAIRLEGVRFGYDPARPVLDGFSLDIPAGQRIAVVGATGSGKSTLVQLLNRFYEPQAGTIAIDGTDLARLDQRVLRRRIGVVLQDNALFSGTVLDNLRLADPGRSDAELRAAVRELGADEVLEALPHGLSTPVGPGGAALSHGTRQLVCLVRAFIADPAVLVLDEATSAVDLHTEVRIRAALARLCQGRTSLIIAHRLATVMDCDRVVVLEKGRIVDDGAPAALLATGGPFARLHAAGTAG